MTDRYSVSSIIAVGTLDFINNRPLVRDNAFRMQIAADGNFSLTVLATLLDPTVPGNFVDVTSQMAGAAAITAGGLYSLPFVPWAVRLNVTSVQGTKHVNVGQGWS